MVDSSDEATVYYTAGAIVRCLLRWKKCSSCIKLLSNNNETINIKITDRIVESDERQFLSLCNRGGLQSPQIWSSLHVSTHGAYTAFYTTTLNYGI